MDKKLKKKDNDMFATITITLDCTCINHCSTCHCTATESEDGDRFDTTVSQRADNNLREIGYNLYATQIGAM